MRLSPVEEAKTAARCCQTTAEVASRVHEARAGDGHHRRGDAQLAELLPELHSHFRRVWAHEHNAPSLPLGPHGEK